MCSFAETTHTPQGDGNRLCHAVISSSWKQPTPRKGTETTGYCTFQLIRWKQPTPRKGTETVAVISNPVSKKKQPTPRKGTETSSI